ncbi:MAG: hypothetical protein NTW79_02490 [Candidatus Berkelbacteria bacterium]|nr:hypothetical protein [Candidatus Berkelbacteria bacterium]
MRVYNVAMEIIGDNPDHDDSFVIRKLQQQFKISESELGKIVKKIRDLIQVL